MIKLTGRALVSILILPLVLGACHANIAFKPDASSGSADSSSGRVEGSGPMEDSGLYFDKYGDLYADKPIMDLSSRQYWTQIPALCGAFQALSSDKSTSQDRRYKEQIDLLQQYRRIVQDGPRDCYGPSSSQALLGAWMAVQSSIWKEAIARINAELNRAQASGPTKSSRLLLLIHGFNSSQTESKANYKAVRDRLQMLGHGLSNTLIVPIFWDGLEGPPVNLPWAQAQQNAPLVGLALRRLLNGLIEGVDVHVITHSSGGIVAASMIGDASGAFERVNQYLSSCKDYESPYCRYAKAHAFTGDVNPYADLHVPTLKSLRIGMLAAATPTYSFFFPACPQLGVQSARTTLIFGMNPRDGAVNKGFGLEQVSIFGATTMATGGVRFDRFREVADGLSKDRTIPVTVYGLHLQDAPNHPTNGPLWLGQSHAFSVYLQRPGFETFSNLLMRPETGCLADDLGLCAVSVGAEAAAYEK